MRAKFVNEKYQDNLGASRSDNVKRSILDALEYMGLELIDVEESEGTTKFWYKGDDLKLRDINHNLKNRGINTEIEQTGFGYTLFGSGFQIERADPGNSDIDDSDFVLIIYNKNQAGREYSKMGLDT